MSGDEAPDCPLCRTSRDVYRMARPDTVHAAEWRCRPCDKFIQWAPKPTAERDKAKRPASHRALVKKYGRGYCEMCLRREDDLPPPETLEGHHVEKYADGGNSDRENVWIVCTYCHRIIETMRCYLGHYSKATP